MPKNLRELLAWSRSHQGRKLIRFALSSVITTGVSMSTILITYGFHIISGIYAATLFGNAVAVIPSYYLSRAWVWGKRGKSHWWKEVVPYWSLSVLGIAFSMIGASLVKSLVHHHPHWGHDVNTLLVAAMNLLSFGIFWMLKIAVFNRIFHTNKLADIESQLTSEEEHEPTAAP